MLHLTAVFYASHTSNANITSRNGGEIHQNADDVQGTEI